MHFSLTAIKGQLAQLSRRERRDLFLVCATMFLILCAYPMVRSVATALFLNASGAKNSPYVWLYSVLALAGTVALYNRFQVRISSRHLFASTALASSVALASLVWPAGAGNVYAAYALFIAKEVYIVLLVHLVLGYFNANNSAALAKVVYGPLGACGSIGGVLGGLATGYLAGHFPTELVLILGVVLTLLSGACFWKAADREKFQAKTCEKASPLRSIRGVGSKVLLIVLLVSISQFVITLADFQFNLFLESNLGDKSQKTQFLGRLYSGINTLSMVVQFFVLPFVLSAFSTKTIHHSVPIIYAATFCLGALFGGTALWPVAMVFATFKGLDYSLFAAAKELLYFRFNQQQKYGAKYIVDMVAYRFSKGAISLLLIFFQSAWFVKSATFGLLALWSVCLILFFQHWKPWKYRAQSTTG